MNIMGNNVLAFEQPANFYYRTAQKMIDQGNYIQAVNLFRKAINKEPDNAEFMIGYAELLTDMYKFEESNSILFELIRQKKQITPECFFNLGRNFLGLNDFAKAKDSFERYMEDEPDGEYAEDMDDLLFLMEDQFDLETDLLSDAEEKEAFKQAFLGKKALDMGEYNKAIEILESIRYESNNFLFVKNNLSLAYFCINKKEKALQIAQQVLKKDAKNIHANCNMALFIKDDPLTAHQAKDFLERAISAISDLPDDVYKLAITLCEMQEYERALPFLKQMTEYNPYDEKVLFYLAITLYNQKRFHEAICYLTDIITLDAPGLVASYYIGFIKDVINEQAEFKLLGYTYQVPPDEVKRRIKYLNDCLHLDEESFQSKWKHDPVLKDTLIWGLESGDTYIKKAMVEILSGQNDRESEQILRRYLLRQNQTDDIKNNVFIALKKMGAKEPYIAYMDFHIVEVRVGSYDFDKKQVSEQWQKVFDLISKVMKEHFPAHIPILHDCMDRLDEFARDKNHTAIIGDIHSFSAALHYLALQNSEFEANTEQLALYYETDERHLRSVIERLMKHKPMNI